jgi:hypothetical protein
LTFSLFPFIRSQFPLLQSGNHFSVFLSVDSRVSAIAELKGVSAERPSTEFRDVQGVVALGHSTAGSVAGPDICLEIEITS